MNIKRLLCAVLSVGLAGMAFSQDAEGPRSMRRSRRRVSVPAEPDVAALADLRPDAETAFRFSLEMDHASQLNYPALAESMVRDYGWTPEEVRARYLAVALDPGEKQRSRGRALCAYGELEDDDWLERITPLFTDQDAALRGTALILPLRKLPDMPTKLNYVSEQIDRMSEEPQFRGDISRIFGGLEGIVEYRLATERELDDIKRFVRRLSADPPFVECVVAIDFFLMRFAPEWPKSPERKSLLERWKDSPELSAFARDRMRAALVEIDKDAQPPDPSLK